MYTSVYTSVYTYAWRDVTRCGNKPAEFCGIMEGMTGIEPAVSAWEAEVPDAARPIASSCATVSRKCPEWPERGDAGEL